MIEQPLWKCHVIFARRLEHRRFTKIGELGPPGFANHLEITFVEELDTKVAE